MKKYWICAQPFSQQVTKQSLSLLRGPSTISPLDLVYRPCCVQKSAPVSLPQARLMRHL